MKMPGQLPAPAHYFLHYQKVLKTQAAADALSGTSAIVCRTRDAIW